VGRGVDGGRPPIWVEMKGRRQRRRGRKGKVDLRGAHEALDMERGEGGGTLGLEAGRRAQETTTAVVLTAASPAGGGGG